MSGKELAIRSVIGATFGILAALCYQGLPSNAEQTATVVVAGVLGGLALVTRALTLRRRLNWQQTGPKRKGLDPALWTVVGVVFVVFVGLFIWLFVSAARTH